MLTANELAFHNWQDGLDWDYSEPITQLNLFEMKDIKQEFLDYINQTELSQADKNVIKGVWYGYLSENPYVTALIQKLSYN